MANKVKCLCPECGAEIGADGICLACCFAGLDGHSVQRVALQQLLSGRIVTVPPDWIAPEGSEGARP